MKKILFLFATISILSSCSDESVTPPTPTGTTSGSIVGVWNFDNLTQEDGSVKWDGIEVSSYTGQSSNEVGSVEFKADKTFSSTISYTFTAKFAGVGEQETEIPTTTTTGTYVYDVTAKTLTTTAQGVTSVADVTELTATSLVTVLNVETEQEANGILVNSSNTTTSSYSK